MPTSSEKLISFIQDTFTGFSVTLVCHSMGGLVGRLAIFSGKVPQVKRLIMLGTPNFGAIRTAQLGLLSQIGLRLAGKTYAVFRNPGIRDLTPEAAWPQIERLRSETESRGFQLRERLALYPEFIGRDEYLSLRVRDKVMRLAGADGFASPSAPVSGIQA